MSHPTATDEEATNRRLQAALLIAAFQEAYAFGDVEQLRAHLTALHTLCNQDIKRQSGHWLAHFADLNVTAAPTWQRAVEDLAWSVFTEIIEDLPKVKLDPNRNAYGLLMTMAHHALYDLNQQAQDRRRRPAAESPQPGDRDASMAPTNMHTARGLDFDDDGALRDVLDPAADFTDRVLERQRLRECWPIVEGVLGGAEEVDRQIFALRVDHDPPMPFKQIAQELGPGWTETAAKQRFYRITLLLKEQLRDLYE